MARANIIDNLGEGQYTIEVIKNTEAIQARISEINSEISILTAQKAGATGTDASVISLQILSLEKQKSKLESITNTTMTAWAADYETELSGEVGIINIPDEPDRFVNIKPGGAAYDQQSDGDVFPIMAMLPETAYYNRGILPGVQRWKPQYRYGRITAINSAESNCTVVIVPAYSSQQGLEINPPSNATLDSLGESSADPSGWDSFQERYPDSEIVTNTDPGSAVTLTESKLAQLQQVNQSVNDSHTYEHDEDDDTWNIMEPGDTGDCEDFALTKMQELIDKGWDPADLHLTGCEVNYSDGSTEGHAVLTIDTDQGTYVLDNRYDDIALASNSQFGDYAWTQRLNGGIWEYVVAGYEIENVLIEYMDCNDRAFSIGDDVLVSFSGSWETPKVIGFRSEPNQCPSIVINFQLINEESEWEGRVGIYDTDLGQVLLIGDVARGPVEICSSPVGTTESEETIYQTLLWAVELCDFYSETYTTEDMPLKGYDIQSGELVKSIPWDLKITSSDIEYNIKPQKIAYGAGGLFGIHFAADPQFAGISHHSIETGEGGWLITGYSDLYGLSGIDYADNILYAAIWSKGLVTWTVTSSGLSNRLETNPDNFTARDVKVYNNEIYVLSSKTGTSTSELYEGIYVYDLDHNFIRKFPVSDLKAYADVLHVVGGFVFIPISSGIAVYTADGEYVRTISFSETINDMR